jgi:glycosyltransferase involved in cell wall biosynthesis
MIKLAAINLDLRVQVSIHGEPYLVTNFMKNSISFFKNIWLIIFLRKADSVRLVSTHQIDQILKKYKVNRSRILIAPIPILIPNKIAKSEKQKNTIVFLGRLHSERGIDLWLDIITELYKIRRDFDLLIIGDGELRVKFEKSLSCIPNGPVYKFVGWIEQNNLSSYLTKGKVLLNTAPTESNGSAMREAQMLGLNIVSYMNNGALSNLKFFGRGILIFRNHLEGVSQLNKALDRKIGFKTIQTYRRKQSKMNKQSLNTLARSWLELKNT